MHGFTKRKTIAAVGVIAVLIAAGGAYAYWSGGGSGSGTATVGTSGAVALTATVTPGISPGNSEPVSFAAANATSSSIFVSTVHLVSVTSNVPACVTADFTMDDVTTSDEVLAGATAQALTSGGSLDYANTGVSQDACKDATLTLTLSSS